MADSDDETVIVEDVYEEEWNKGHAASYLKMELDGVRGRLAEVEQRFVRRLNQTEIKEEIQCAADKAHVYEEMREQLEKYQAKIYDEMREQLTKELTKDKAQMYDELRVQLAEDNARIYDEIRQQLTKELTKELTKDKAQQLDDEQVQQATSLGKRKSARVTKS